MMSLSDHRVALRWARDGAKVISSIAVRAEGEEREEARQPGVKRLADEARDLDPNSCLTTLTSLRARAPTWPFGFREGFAFLRQKERVGGRGRGNIGRGHRRAVFHLVEQAQPCPSAA